MKQMIAMGILTVLFIIIFSACGNTDGTKRNQEDNMDNAGISEPYTVDTAISDVINDSVFEDYGRLTWGKICNL